MRKIFTIIMIGFGLYFSEAKSQTTINTTLGSTGYTGGNGVTGNSALTFVVENASGAPVLLDELGDYFQTASNGTTVTLWYSSSSLSGPPTIATPDWTSIATGTIAVPADGIITCFTNLGFLIPSGAQYRFAIQSSTNIRYSGTGAGACTPSLFTSNGISLKCGEEKIAALNVGYAGAFPSPLNNPRWFTGYVTFNPAGPCTSPPTPGTVVSTANPVCLGINFKLSLVGGTTGTGQIYQWQSSPDSVSWGNITGATLPSLQTSQSVTTFYRAAVTCGASTVNSAGLKVETPAPFPGGTYTINSAVSTGGNNFASFGDAVNAIKCGIAGPVVFNVVTGSGPYVEQVVIPSFGGVSATNRVTFNGNGETLAFPGVDGNARAVIKLDGADFITFKNLTVEATGGNFGWGIHLTNDANNDSIVNCTINTDVAATTTNYAGIIISASNTSPTTAGITANRTVIAGNTINGGYYGISNYGNSAAPFIDSNQIINNNINDFYYYGLYNFNANNSIISGNLIQRPLRTTVGGGYGIFLSGNITGSVVEKNRIRNLYDAVAGGNTTTTYGVYVGGDGSPASPVKIINNIISDINNDGIIYGIYNTGGANMQAYHNTISLDYTPSAATANTYGFYQVNSDTGILFKNNLITITRGGTGSKYGIYKATTLTPLISNNNDVYVNSPTSTVQAFGFSNVALTTLADWQAATAHDLNSVSIDPVYLTPGTDYTPTAVSLNDRGAPVGVTTDITGAPRSATNPDVGAIEFSVGACATPPTAGTAVGPLTNICANTLFPLQLTGNSAGLGQTYQWQSSPNGSAPWTPVGTPLAVPDTSISATSTLYYRVAVTCSGNTAFSTAVIVNIDQPLSGNFTINSAVSTGGTNFQSFTDAINKLKCGIIGPVTINVVAGSGPYTEQVSIPAISGTSASSRLTFNCNGETLQFTPTTTVRHILQLNGADYVSINNLQVIGLDPTYGYGIHLQNGSDNDSINNCIIDLSAITSTTTANSSCIVASNSSTSTTTSGNTANNVVVNNCTTKGGIYGVVMYGDATNTTVGNKVLNCTIKDFYSGGVYLYYNSAGEVSNNDISRANAATVGTFYGVTLGTSSRNIIVNANRIHDSHNTASSQTGVAYGIQLTGAGSRSGFETKITNNLIYNLNSGSGTIYALYNSTSDSALFYHNTVVLDNAASTAGSTYGMYQTGTALGLQIKNNIFYITRGGTGTNYVLYFLSPASTIASNNNVLYVNAPAGVNYTGYYGVAFATLADWKTANTGAYDQQSVSVDPLFTNPASGDYKPTEVSINDIGQNVGVTTDIIGNPRSTSPDPGAYEFTLSGCTNPPTTGTVNSTATTVCSGTNFTLDLTGNSTGAGLTYQWQTSPDNVSWTNTGSLQTASAFTTSQTSSTYYRCGLTCSGGTTVYTAGLQISSPALVSGIFTINSSLPTGGSNFTSFGDAINYIKCGISGPVVFNVAPGSTFTEQVIIPDIAGTSAINTITINGNGASVSYASTSAAEKAVVKLKGTDYVTIDSLIINATGSLDTEFGYGIQLVDNADYNTIRKCEVNTAVVPVTAASTNFAGIVINASSATSPTTTGNSQCDNNIIAYNKITGGYAGISMVANGITNAISGNVVQNNSIQDFYLYGIYSNGNINLMVEGNDISRPVRSTVGTFYGMFLGTGHVGAKISKNQIHDIFTGNTASTSTAYGIYTSGSDGLPGLENVISNNMLYGFNNSGTQYAFYNTGSNYVKFYYNSVLLDGPATSTTTYVTRGIYQSTTDTAVEFKNNIVYISRPATGPVQCIYIASATADFKSDFNNLFVTTTTGTVNAIGYFNGTTYLTLADWRTNALRDSNSINADPLFVTVSDLHIQSTSPCAGVGTPIATVNTDIDGETRPGSNTDIGADEIGAIIPITLKDISAVIVRQQSIVNWSTAAELNFDRFEVERSLDGSRFVKAGTVSAIAAGTWYSFTDWEIVNKVNPGSTIYYRLKMVDRDGKYKYSVVVTVKTGMVNSLVTVYPNPFMKELYLKINAVKTEKVGIKLIDQTGRLLSTYNPTVLAGTNTINIPAAKSLAAGTYILVAEINGEHFYFRVVK